MDETRQELYKVKVFMPFMGTRIERMPLNSYENHYRAWIGNNGIQNSQG